MSKEQVFISGASGPSRAVILVLFVLLVLAIAAFPAPTTAESGEALSTSSSIGYIVYNLLDDYVMTVYDFGRTLHSFEPPGPTRHTLRKFESYRYEVIAEAQVIYNFFPKTFDSFCSVDIRMGSYTTNLKVDFVNCPDSLGFQANINGNTVSITSRY